MDVHVLTQFVTGETDELVEVAHPFV